MKAAQYRSTLNKSARKLLRVLLPAAALTLPPAIATAQDTGGGGGGFSPLSPKISIGGEQKRKLTPEEEEQQQRIDADYKAATSKIPTQKASPDPWGDVRQASPGSSQKTSSSTQNASAQKKKPSTHQPQ